MVWFKCQTISSTPAGGTDGPHSAQHKCKEKPPSFPLSCLSHSAPPKGESSQLGDTLGLWAGILKLPFHIQQLPVKSQNASLACPRHRKKPGNPSKPMCCIRIPMFWTKTLELIPCCLSLGFLLMLGWYLPFRKASWCPPISPEGQVSDTAGIQN